mmetsp:Transcript_12397/g.26244  ORF Transcript_12397/g.26244 Transcript_12397/m.26244 type:complete len:86 (+) Transcript_12397:411-668(+)
MASCTTNQHGAGTNHTVFRYMELNRTDQQTNQTEHNRKHQRTAMCFYLFVCLFCLLASVYPIRCTLCAHTVPSTTSKSKRAFMNK